MMIEYKKSSGEDGKFVDSFAYNHKFITKINATYNKIHNLYYLYVTGLGYEDSFEFDNETELNIAYREFIRFMGEKND